MATVIIANITNKLLSSTDTLAWCWDGEVVEPFSHFLKM